MVRWCVDARFVASKMVGIVGCGGGVLVLVSSLPVHAPSCLKPPPRLSLPAGQVSSLNFAVFWGFGVPCSLDRDAASLVSKKPPGILVFGLLPVFMLFVVFGKF